MTDFIKNFKPEFHEETSVILTLNNILEFRNGNCTAKRKKDFIKPFEYLNRYLYAINDIDNIQNTKGKNSGIIWQCWLQGEENMPELVRACTESVKKYNPDREIVLITLENFTKYVSIPEYIVEKFRTGIISHAHFADIIRLALLEKYGGVWLDSTILETGSLPEEAFSSDFFTYKNNLGLCFDRIKNFKTLELMCNFFNRPVMLPSTWFIASASNYIIISGWLKLLLEYWKNEKAPIDYFIMDYFFVLLILNNSTCRKIFTEVPTYLTTHAEILQSAMPEDFNNEMYEEIKSFSPIHKLTLNYTPDNSNTKRMYNKIIWEKLF